MMSYCFWAHSNIGILRSLSLFHNKYIRDPCRLLQYVTSYIYKKRESSTKVNGSTAIAKRYEIKQSLALSLACCSWPWLSG